jgi:hypothetical protein
MIYDNQTPNKAKSTLRNAVGVGASIGTIVAFDL